VACSYSNSTDSLIFYWDAIPRRPRWITTDQAPLILSFSIVFGIVFGLPFLAFLCCGAIEMMRYVINTIKTFFTSCFLRCATPDIQMVHNPLADQPPRPQDPKVAAAAAVAGAEGVSYAVYMPVVSVEALRAGLPPAMSKHAMLVLGQPVAPIGPVVPLPPARVPARLELPVRPQ
jgi:hypothetical protein